MSTRIEEKKLANGVTLIAKQVPDVEWQLCTIVIHAGAASDPKELPGLAHFVEHMVSANHSLETIDLKNYFKREGGYIDLGSTGFFSTSYTFKLPSDPEVLRGGLRLVKELVSDIRFERHLERERSVIKSEYDTRFPVPELKKLRDRIWSILRRDTAVEHRNRPLGEEHAIAIISLKDLQDFYDAQYHAGNMTVLALGACSADELLGLLMDSGFDTVENRGNRPVYDGPVAFSPRSETYIEYKISDYLKYSDQKPVSTYESHLVLPMGVNDAALDVAAQMLSRTLFQEVREKAGLAYDTRAGSSCFRVYRQLSIEANNFDVSRLEELKRIIEDTIVHVGSDRELFEFTRGYMIKSLRMLDVAGWRMLELAENDLVYEGRVTEKEDQIRNLEQLTYEDVRGIFALMKPENRLTVVELP